MLSVRETDSEEIVDITSAMSPQQWSLLKPKRQLGHPKIIYIHYTKKTFMDQSIQKIFYLYFEKGSTALHNLFIFVLLMQTIALHEDVLCVFCKKFYHE